MKLTIGAKSLDSESIIALVNIVEFNPGKKWIEAISKALPGKITNDNGMYIYNKNTLLCYEGKSKNIVIPEGVEIIGDRVFEGDNGEWRYGKEVWRQESECKRITFPKTLKVIGRKAFYGMYFEKLEIPKGVTTIRQKAFVDVSIKEDKLVLPDSIKILEPYALSEIDVKKIELPKNLTVISKGLCYYSKNLKKVVMPEKIIKISKEAFCYCEKLDATNMVAMDSLVQIGKDAFSGCQWTNLVIGKNVKAIGAEALFQYGKGSVLIKGYPKKYERNCFGTTDAFKITFEQGIKSAWTDMQYYCSKIKKNGKRNVGIYWNQITNAKGYQLQFSTSKNFKKILKKVEVKKQNVTKKIFQIKSKKRVYARIRPYDIVDGNRQYGEWVIAR